MADGANVSDIIATANLLASQWYNAVKFNVPVVAPSPSALALAQSAGATQTAFAAQNPTLAGLLINPGFILLVVAVVLIILLMR